MFESYGLGFTAEECVLLIQLIEARVQVCNYGLGFVCKSDQLDSDFFVLHLNISSFDPMRLEATKIESRQRVWFIKSRLTNLDQMRSFERIAPSGKRGHKRSPFHHDPV